MSNIVCKGLVKTFQQGDQTIYGLNHVSLTIKQGEMTVLSGPSGSGKTTLLNAIGGLDEPDSGTVYVGDVEITGLTKSQRADVRLQRIGFVFQAYNLIPVLTVRENIEFVMQLQGVAATERQKRCQEILAEVGLTGLESRRPAQLSGGQQQRVAVARAIVSKPVLILADEPTANLDSKTSAQLLELFTQLNRQHGITFLIATHDAQVFDYCRRHIYMVDGKIVTDTRS
ncbi:ABC transporter ATP-binding protein [Shewanella schlegeliana]|uniref:ABC transporter ATP-binding protein n=1 Tax=Shewanella schlegeliana TaxID=190308 RepID=A0ABS1T1T0_9GAMM|nr:ABC transporter ATP-binding protein [Shewanella schlegeliana]MBL4914634.1 ABC transporter ATP-binding protein [Shewanella schlegeliana]MCL1109550.1 ABC transporter ATP-binding protein [Shewanella schlegeliana]GIU29666.1 ABC transporter ATP-binding protein [Shewanella schlegeliana]